MKKSLLSIVLSLAILATAFGTMLAMPASAANGRDFLAEGSISLSDGAADAGATAEIVDGALVFTATAAGQEVSLAIEGEANMNDYPYWELTLESDIQWNACLYNANDGKWMFANGDWFPQFAGGVNASSPINAGSEDVKIDVTGCYTWTGAALPANAAVKSATFIAQGAGTIVVSKCAMTDGISDVHLFPENEWNDSWNQYDCLADSSRVNDWVGSDPAKSGDSEIVVSFNEETWQMNFGNTNGGWPSASIAVNKTVDYATSAIDVDLSVLSGASTTLYVFFGDATPDDFEGEGKAYGTILADVTAGNYYGYVKLSDILSADSDVIDANGQVKISYVKIFATSNGSVMDPAVTVNWIDLCYYEENPTPADLGDVDLDGDVDTYDALLVYNAQAGYITLEDETAYDRADHDRDYVITINDAKLAFCAAAGIDLADLDA